MDRRFLPSEDVFFLKIAGDSMVGRGIFDGDYVMVRPTRDVSEGDMIAARIGEEATVKTFTRRDGSVVLTPANPEASEIVIGPAEDFAVLGQVCAVFRPFCEDPLEEQEPEE